MTTRRTAPRWGIRLSALCTLAASSALAQEPPPAQPPPAQQPPAQQPPAQQPPAQQPPAQPPPAQPPPAQPPPAQQYPQQQPPPPQQYPPQQYPPQQYPPQQYPPQQYPPQQYPPQQYPPQQYPPQHAQPAPAPPPADDRGRSKRREPRGDLGKLVNFRFGWNVYGAGTLAFEGECSGNCPLGVTNTQSSATDGTRVLLGLDMLFGSEPLQIGFGLWFMPHVSIEPERGATGGGTERELGFEFTPPLIVGGVIPLGEQVSLSLRGFVGPQLLFGGGKGAIEQDVDAYEAFCGENSSLRDCDAGAETRLGLTPGFAAGALFRAGPGVSLSGDLMVQYMNLELFSFEAAGSGWSMRQSYGYEGLRFWAVLGVGFGG